MKKLSFILMSILITSITYSQDTFVEVVVKDTMLLEPEEWIVFVNIQKQYDYTTTTTTIDTVFDPARTPPTRVAPEVMSLDELKKLVLKFKGQPIFTDTSYTKSLMNRRNYETKPQVLNVRFTSRINMENYLEAASAYNELENHIINAKHSKLEMYYENMEKKLIQRATKNATRLALLSGKKIGNVLVISEVTESGTQNLVDFLQTMLGVEAMSNKLERYFTSTDKIIVQKALRIRFALL